MVSFKPLSKNLPRFRMPVALIFVAIAILLRAVIIGLGWPFMNSDEATMGIAAINIAYHHQHPAFFYGQSYMGTLEAYVGAVLFHIIGVSAFSLRLGLILIYAAFLIALYMLARLLFTKNIALISVALLCLGSPSMLMRQLSAVGGAMETLLFGTLAFVLASWLAFTFYDPNLRVKRLFAYAALGLTIGLGVWSHMIVLPFIAMALLLILISCFRELWSMKPLLLIVGTIVGLLPLLIYDIHNPSQNAIITLLRLHSAGGVSQGATTYSHFNSILGTILISIPTMTGAVHLYPFSSDPEKWREQLSSHALFQGVWGTIFVIFLGIALVLTAYSLFKNRSISNANDATEKRTMQVRYMARLFLLGGAVLTLLSYMMSPAPAVVPVTSARYLVGLLIITPSLIALPYSLLSKYRNSQSFSWPAVLAVVGLGILSFIFMIYFYGTFTMFGQQISGVQKLNQQQSELVNGLERNHITRIYSDYWTCDRVIFQSDEHIICDVLRDNLRTGQNRYLPFRAVVMSSPHVAYVFTLHSPQDVLLHSRKFQQTFSFGGYHVYVP